MSRNDYRPLNVRDALSYLDKVKVSNRIWSSSSGCPRRARGLQLRLAVADRSGDTGSRVQVMGLLNLFRC